MTKNILLGVLERISSREDLPLIALEVNLEGKEKREQKESINRIEHDMATIGYNGIFEIHNNTHGLYHLYFRRGKPNA
ncbi:MAG: hypothetical protein AABY15_09640 [Nanoarchaeota archaeon]